jgi:hypothetical protein
MFGLRRCAGALDTVTALGLVVAALLACKSDKEEEPLPDVVEEVSAEQPEASTEVQVTPPEADAGEEPEKEPEKPKTVWRPRDAGAATPSDGGQATSDAAAARDAAAAVACAQRCQDMVQRCRQNERAGTRGSNATPCPQKLVECMAACQ